MSNIGMSNMLWQNSEANKRQVGADHYKNGGEEHWDRVHRLKLDYFQGQITKYVERCWLKNGLQDLEKAQHFLQKYIELAKASAEFKQEIAERRKPAVPYDDIPSGDTIVGEAKPEIVELPRGAEVLNQQLVDATTLFSNQPDIDNVIGLLPADAKFYRVGEVMPTGWVQFVFEGIQSEGALYTCRECRAHFNAPVSENPHGYHSCHRIADQCQEPKDYVLYTGVDEGEPTSAYVAQG